MRILTVPQDTATLRTKSEPIQEIDARLRSFLKDLGDTLRNQRNPQGVGLSAIQVGHPIRVFATLLPAESGKRKAESNPPVTPSRSDGGRGEPITNNQVTNNQVTNNQLLFYLNPEIVDHSPELTLGEALVTENRKQKTMSNEQNATPASPIPYSLNPKPFLEGCLSIPQIYGPVPRWEWIDVRATALSGSNLSSSIPYSLNPIPFTLDGLASRVFQHELDHLDGILFTDRTVEAGLSLYEAKEKDLVPMEM